ncbi:DUF2255 family protein [Cryptosporangium phraense]|uniref:DUF2255 family protein n=1 Tax=Cryptosporangium phraense TaxID=2593070 RepID=A0A545AEF6_9ACTN|nr:DUF2255 family protein [Cryptosporangium phraense]TQS39693.1 DUF2255 family protein [Cryptosporangium phraense]
MTWTPVEAAILAVAPMLHVIAGSGYLGGARAEVGMVVVDGRLYVRAYRGRESAWFRLAVAQPRGRIRTGTLERDVTFGLYDGPLDAIDEAYRAKYGNAGGPATHPRTREATLRVEPA